MSGRDTPNRFVGIEALEQRNLFASAFIAKIDFQPVTASTYSGYMADIGKTYALRTNGLTYGWKASNEKDHYDRNSSRSPDQRYDTTAKMSSSDVWEIKVPTGWYDVDVYVGDANQGSADMRINVEGKLATKVQLHYAEKRFGEGHIKVYVSDGKLTLSSASGAKNNALTHVHVKSGSAPQSYTYKNNLKWAKGSITSPVGRVEGGVVRMGDKVYFMGGFTNPAYTSVTSRVDILNLKTNSWSKGAALPTTQTHAAVANDERYIYWAGGQYGALYSRSGSTQMWRYDTQGNKWEKLNNIPEVRFGAAMAYVNGSLYLFGGDGADRNTPSNKAWKLDLANRSAGWKSIAPMPRAADHMGHAVLNGKIYVFGGEHDHGNSYVQHRDTYTYDPKTNTWSKKADMPTGMSHFEGNVVEHKGKFYLFGGKADAQQISNEVRSYDPATNKWTKHTTMPEKRMGGAGWVYNNKFYYLTGDASGMGQPRYVLQASILS